MIYENKVDGAVREFKNRTHEETIQWQLANDVLYNLCKEHPGHTNDDEIVAKIWLIGRSYAAAIERRKNAELSADDFYYNEVARKMRSIGCELDNRLRELKTYQFLSGVSLDAVLDLHGLLTRTFKELTGMDKRSLASKYLHFHCPNMFLIYDSRANTAMRNFVSISKESKNKHISAGRDKEYTDFCVRGLELMNYVCSKHERKLTPRELDDLLLRRGTD